MMLQQLATALVIMPLQRPGTVAAAQRYLPDQTDGATASAGPPTNFSCAIGLAGVEFARRLQPERTNFSGVVAALVTPHCGGNNPQPPPSPPTPPGPPHPGPHPPPAPPEPPCPKAALPKPPTPPAGACSAPVDNASIVCCPAPGMVLNSSNVPSAAVCSTRCQSNSSCAAFTWHDHTCGGYALDCYFILLPLRCDPWSKVRKDPGHYSGICTHATTDLRTSASSPSPRHVGARHPGHGLWGWRAGTPDLPHATSCELHVDATKGKDAAGGGSVISPLKTIEFAVGQKPPHQPCAILLAAGTHRVHRTVTISPAQSNLTIMSQPGATAVVSGGTELKGLQWEAVTIDPTPDGGYGGLGKGRTGAPPPPPLAVKVLRAKVPLGMPQLYELFGAQSGRLVPARGPDNPQANDPFAVKIGGARVTSLRKFGNSTEVQNTSWSRDFPFYSEGGGGSYFPVYRVGVGGPASWFDPPVSYWAQTQVSGGQAATYQIPENISVDHFPGPRLKTGSGGLVFSTHCKNWGGWVFEIGNVTHASTTPNTTNISFSKGGWQEARGCTGMGNFFVSHRLELLTQPGEWFHDVEGGYLYMGFEPSKREGVPTTGETLYGPTVATIFSVQGSQHSPVRNFRVSGVIFKHVAPSFLEPYAVPSGGDYSLHKGGTVLLNGTEDCTVDHSLFDGNGGNGVFLNDYNRRALVAANEFRDMGEAGVLLSGSTDWVDGRSGNQPRFCNVTGNYIHNVGLYVLQAPGIMHAVTCQNHIDSNILFHGPRAGFNFNDHFGGGTILTQNLFFDWVQKSTDHGAINFWDRTPHLTTVLGINGSAGSLIPAFIHVDRNFIFDGGFGIDTDDGSQRINVTNNVVLTGLWKDGIANSHKSYSGNVELFGDSCFSSGQWDKGSSNFTSNHCFVGGKPSYFNCNCNISCTGWPEVCTPCPVLRNNHYYQQNQTYTVCGNLTLSEIQAKGLEIGSTVSPVPEADEIVKIVKAALKTDDLEPAAGQRSLCPAALACSLMIRSPFNNHT